MEDSQEVCTTSFSTSPPSQVGGNRFWGGSMVSKIGLMEWCQNLNTVSFGGGGDYFKGVILRGEG